jgi:hypothetical protein
MMAVTTIVNFYDVLEYMQSITALTATQEAALSRIHKRIERSVRRYLNCDILQPASTYEEYLPAPNPYDQHWQEAPHMDFGPTLVLTHYPVRDITSVYEESGAYAGFGTNAWSSDALLSEGEDYFADYEFSGFSRSGWLIRVGNSWPARARSVKVTYTAGYTADELKGDVTDLRLDASDITQAIITATGEAYNLSIEVKDRSGPLKSERLGDYSQTFADVDLSKRFGNSGLSETVRQMLNPFKRVVMV